MDPQLRRLSANYKRGRSGESTVRDLYQKYIVKREKALIDAAAAALGLNVILTADRVDLHHINPQMEEAFMLAFPQKELAELESMTTEQLSGLASAWKGKYFEVLVRDKLNAGEALGDIQLEPGQTAELAESVTQPGWDLVILNADGSTATELSLKATESLSYVKGALERYPDIQVLTTDEVLQHPNAVSDMILGSGIKNQDLEQAIHEPMASLFDTAGENVLEAIVPGLPFVLIAVGEGRHILAGRRSFAQVMPTMLARMAKTGTAMGAGYFVGMLFGAIPGIAAAVGVRLALSKHESSNRVTEGLADRLSLMEPLAGKYVIEK